MNQQELYEYWQSRGKERPMWIRENREQLQEHISTREPIPEGEASAHELRAWLEKYKGTMTRQLNPAQSSDDGETDNTSDAERGN